MDSISGTYFVPVEFKAQTTIRQGIVAWNGNAVYAPLEYMLELRTVLSVNNDQSERIKHF